MTVADNVSMTASLVLLMVVVVSAVLLGSLFAFGRRPASANRGSVDQSDGSSWIGAIMTDGGSGGSDCAAGDAGCSGGDGD
jgi:hypothetical protein